jgi:hypothetical protein
MKEITHTHKYSAKLIFFKNGSRIERRIFYSFDEFYPLCFVCWSIEKSPGVRYELAQVPRTVHKIDWWITASRDRPSSYRILFALTIKGGQQSVWLLSLSLSLSFHRCESSWGFILVVNKKKNLHQTKAIKKGKSQLSSRIRDRERKKNNLPARCGTWSVAHADIQLWTERCRWFHSSCTTTTATICLDIDVIKRREKREKLLADW